MRFAYIDSHGNEVPIPSVDALALRIELGAIGPETELYDAQADRWGPAKAHEIFHTLSRDVEGEGFVAPPPPVGPPPSVADRGAPADLPGAADESQAPVAEARTAETPADEAHAAPVERAGSAPAAKADVPKPDTSFGLTLADPRPGHERRAGGPASGRPAQSGAAEGPGAFDFSGGLELEPSLLEAADDEPGPTKAGPAEEAAMDFGASAGHAGDADRHEVDQPLPELAPTPIWMEQDGPSGGKEGALDLSLTSAQRQDEPAPIGRAGTSGGGAAAAPAPAAAPPREQPRRKKRAESKSRPSRPRHRRVRSALAPLATVVLLGAAGGSAYLYWPVYWPLLSERLGLDARVPRPPVVLPVIPADLEPRMRALGERALGETFEELDERTSGPDVPTAPPEDWLFGVYLANASRFEEVDAFWSGMERFMSGLREREHQLFHVRYLEAAKAELGPDTALMLTERADSGFVAATAARGEVYDLMDELIDAALTLHGFLVENEGDIAYEPAAFGVSGDPLLEAVPSSDEVRTAMWDMLEDLTNALDALGTLDLVTRQELLEILLDRVGDVAVQ